jgi:hypothetical protein
MDRKEGLALRSWLSLPLTSALAVVAALVVVTAEKPAAGAGIVLACLLAVVMAIVSAVKPSNGVQALLLFMPFSGLLAIGLYPQSFLGELFRDVVFVIPLYVGYVLHRQPGHLRPHWAGLRLPLLLMLCLILVQTQNSSIPNYQVALIGLRSWVLFVGLLFVGRAAARDADLPSWCFRLSVASLPGLVVGIIEAILLAEGKTAFVASLYGPAGDVLSGTFGGLQVAEGGAFNRVPGLFPFSVAYYSFAISSLIPSYVTWRRGATPIRRRFGAVAFSVAVLAVATSGQRLGLALLPIILVIALSLDPGGMRPRRVVLSTLGLLGALSVLGVKLASLPRYFLELGTQEGNDVLVGGLQLARRTTTLGLGVGLDNNAARNYGGSDFFDRIGGQWQESYLVKAWLEVGVAGMVLVVLAAVLLLRLLLLAARQTRGTPEGSLVAIVTAFAIATLVVSLKAAVLDQAPANVYFWLWCGLAIGAADPATRRVMRAPAEVSGDARAVSV